MSASQNTHSVKGWQSHWLIERGSNQGSPQVYIEAGTERPGARWYGKWTTDPWKARRWATEQEAEQFVDHYAIEYCAVVSHGFEGANG